MSHRGCPSPGAYQCFSRYSIALHLLQSHRSLSPLYPSAPILIHLRKSCSFSSSRMSAVARPRPKPHTWLPMEDLSQAPKRPRKRNACSHSKNGYALSALPFDCILLACTRSTHIDAERVKYVRRQSRLAMERSHALRRATEIFSVNNFLLQ